jgi:hypothetical protein
MIRSKEDFKILFLSGILYWKEEEEGEEETLTRSITKLRSHLKPIL